jgi:glycosyltransferase involved in cell wall biosynthesis
MLLSDALNISMWVSFAVLFSSYFGYFLVLLFFHRRACRKKESAGSSDFFYPSVSLIVPTFNEEKIIDKKIQNIEELSYPDNKMEVIYVDGHSQDQTVTMIQERMRTAKKTIRLIQQTRREGYNRGIIDGILNSTGEIVVLTDAASYHYSDAIKHLVRPLRNKEIGAVTGKEIVLGTNGVGPQLEASYRFFYDFMREAETEIDSTPDTKGEILAVRRDICNGMIPRLRSPNASFDSAVPYQAKLMGYRTVYEPQAKYSEYCPSSFVDRLKQQVRRATYLIGGLMQFKNMILNRKYGRFGLLILPAHFIIQFVVPWVFFVVSSCLLALTFVDPLKTLPLWIPFLAILVTRKGRLFAASFIQSQVALAMAVFRLATRRQSLYIQTIQSTRK